jgi:hypothetical protein
MLMTTHPTEELLAQYIDDRLDSSNREPVTEHLVSCGECREIVLMSTAFQESEEPVAQVVAEDLPPTLADAAPDSQAVTGYNRGAVAARSGETLLVRENPERYVSGHRFGARRRMAAIGSFAAAAAIAVISVRPVALFGYRVADLVAASQDVADRTSMGRLAGEFPYASKPKTNRGPGEVDLENNDFAQKMKLYEIASKIADAKAKGKSVDPHVAGLSTLLIAKTRPEFDEAVGNLEKALANARGAERDAIATDLAASLIGRARWSGDDDDYRYALRLSNDVLTRKQSPAALWNRAIATETLYAKAEALRAWDDYLKVDSNSPWAKEAMEHKAELSSYP